MRKFFPYLILTVIFLSVPLPPAEAFWVWTPESNKWVNPKYTVKETPQEQLEFALSFYEANEFEKASTELNKLLKHYPKAKEAAEAQFYLADILDQERAYVKAFKSYQIVIDKYPFSERFGEVVERQYEIGVTVLEGKVKVGFFQGGAGIDAFVVEVFRTVIKNAPYGKYAASAQYKIALYLQKKGLFQEARDEFEKTMNDYPESEWAQAARYQIALSDAKRSADAPYDQKITEIAIQELEGYLDDNPNAKLSKEAEKQINTLREKEAEQHFMVAEFYEKGKKYQAAKIYYNKIVEEYKGTSFAPKALNKIREINKKGSL